MTTEFGRSLRHEVVAPLSLVSWRGFLSRLANKLYWWPLLPFRSARSTSVPAALSLRGIRQGVVAPRHPIGLPARRAGPSGRGSLAARPSDHIVGWVSLVWAANARSPPPFGPETKRSPDSERTALASSIGSRSITILRLPSATRWPVPSRRGRSPTRPTKPLGDRVSLVRPAEGSLSPPLRDRA